MENSANVNIRNAIDAHQEVLKAVIQNSAEGIAVVDQNGHFVLFNEVMKELLGTGPVDSKNYEWARIFNIYYPTGHQLVEKNRLPIVRALKGEVIKNEIYLFKNPKKGDLLVSISASPIKDNDGYIIGSLVIDRDITEQQLSQRKLEQANQELKETQHELHKANRMLQNAQRIARLGYIELDLPTKSLYWSDEVYQIYGLDPGDEPVNFDAFINLIHPDDRQAYRMRLENLECYQQEEILIEYRIIHKNQNICHLIETGRLICDDNMVPSKLESTVQDITAPKKREIERTRLIDELLQQNANLEQFAYIISHNLRAPVANVIGVAEVLKDENLLTTDQKELVRGLAVSVAELDSVIKDLNFILQIKKNIHEKKEHINLVEVFNQVKNGLSGLIDKADITIKTSFEATGIYSIRPFIHSIFLNLISNSIKYRRENVRSIIEISSTMKNNNLLLRFRDNGMGIDLVKNKADIFGLYKRFHSHVEGRGIGLFAVKSQIELLNGHIAIKSQVNEGAEFDVEIPML